MTTFSTFIRATDGSEKKLLENIGEITVSSALAYLGAKIISAIKPAMAIAPASAAVYMSTVWAVTTIADRIFTYSPDKNGIVLAFHVAAMFTAAYSAGITFINGLVVEGITLISYAILKYLYNNAS